jgi:hypothetical protein
MCFRADDAAAGVPMLPVVAEAGVEGSAAKVAAKPLGKESAAVATNGSPGWWTREVWSGMFAMANRGSHACSISRASSSTWSGDRHERLHGDGA